MKKIILLLIIFILSIPISIGITKQVNTTIKNLNLDLLLKRDGSMLVSQEFFQTYPDLGFDNGSIIFDFVIGTTDFTNLKIYDLSQPSNNEYTRADSVRELISRTRCDNHYSVNGDTLSICAPMKKDRSLHFKLNYLLYSNIKCIEEEKRRHEFAYGTKLQQEPYSIEITTRVEEGMNYVTPINCPSSPKPWEKRDIENGIVCKIENVIITNDSKENLFFVIAGNLTGDRVDIIDKSKTDKENKKELIKNILIFLNFVLALLGIQYAERIKEFYNRNTKNKLITLSIIILIFIAYLLFLL